MSWILVFILGFTIINLIAGQLTILEKIGFTMPIGLGVNTFLLIVLDVVGVAINSEPLIVTINVLLLLILLVVYYLKNKDVIENTKNYKLKFDLEKLKNINFGWLVLLGFALYVMYGISSKALFWPVYIYDSANGYDFIAKAIAAEGTFNNSVFDATFPLHSIRSVYPPLVPVAFGMAYIFGGASSKIVVVFFYLSIFIVLYAYIKKYTTHYAAALFSFLLAITPEFAAFSALSSPNPPCTFYNSMGLLSIYIWYREKENSYFAIGLACLLLGLWTRTESVMFVGTAGLIVLLHTIKTKKYTSLVLFGGLSLFIVAFWQVYVKNMLPVDSVNPIMDNISFDLDRLSRMMAQVYDVTFSSQYYGVVVYLFLIAIVLNFYFLVKEKDTLMLLGIVILPWIFYMMIYYIIDTDYMPGSVAWITAGYKRGFFYFLPLILFYVASTKVIKILFQKILNV